MECNELLSLEFLITDYYATRQRYENKTVLRHKCEQVVAKACAEEESRLYLSTGAVVKHMKNGK